MFSANSRKSEMAALRQMCTYSLLFLSSSGLVTCVFVSISVVCVWTCTYGCLCEWDRWCVVNDFLVCVFNSGQIFLWGPLTTHKYEPPVTLRQTRLTRKLSYCDCYLHMTVSCMWWNKMHFSVRYFSAVRWTCTFMQLSNQSINQVTTVQCKKKNHTDSGHIKHLKWEKVWFLGL